MLAKTAVRRGRRFEDFPNFFPENKKVRRNTDREEEDGAVYSYGRVLQSRGVDRFLRDLGHPLFRFDFVGKIFRRA